MAAVKDIKKQQVISSLVSLHINALESIKRLESTKATFDAKINEMKNDKSNLYTQEDWEEVEELKADIDAGIAKL